MDLDSYVIPPAPTADPVAQPAVPPATPQPAARPAQGRDNHPLIWMAVMVWLSVDAIGDGLLALVRMLDNPTASGSSSTSPAASASVSSPTGSDDDTETPTPSPSW